MDFYAINISVTCERSFRYQLLLCHETIETLVRELMLCFVFFLWKDLSESAFLNFATFSHCMSQVYEVNNLWYERRIF